MKTDLESLTERERAVLRLLAKGHDVKSMAIALGLSIHTINERLRDARQKMAAPSSREAARRLAAWESGTDKFSVPQLSGVADKSVCLLPRSVGDERWWMTHRLAIGAIGGTLMTILIAVLAALLVQPDISANATPTVISTQPIKGATIAAGQFDLTVTFDRPMEPKGYSFVQVSPETYPDCERQARVRPDRRTFILRCRAQPGRRYEVWFNRPPYTNFHSVRGVPAEPFRLMFRTVAPD